MAKVGTIRRWEPQPDVNLIAREWRPDCNRLVEMRRLEMKPPRFLLRGMLEGEVDGPRKPPRWRKPTVNVMSRNNNGTRCFLVECLIIATSQVLPLAGTGLDSFPDCIPQSRKEIRHQWKLLLGRTCNNSKRASACPYHLPAINAGSGVDTDRGQVFPHSHGSLFDSDPIFIALSTSSIGVGKAGNESISASKSKISIHETMMGFRRPRQHL